MFFFFHINISNIFRTARNISFDIPNSSIYNQQSSIYIQQAKTMHASSIITLLLALSAGALASPTTQVSPASLSKRDIGIITNHVTGGCSSAPVISAFQDPKAASEVSNCMKFKANKGDHVGVHWGDLPSTKGLTFYYGSDCKIPANNQVLHRSKGSQDDCYVSKNDQIMAARFITAEARKGDPPQNFWVDQ